MSNLAHKRTDKSIQHLCECQARHRNRAISDMPALKQSCDRDGHIACLAARKRKGTQAALPADAAAEPAAGMPALKGTFNCAGNLHPR
jgi:uncharacterized protein YdaU (DUF1376 family)